MNIRANQCRNYRQYFGDNGYEAPSEGNVRFPVEIEWRPLVTAAQIHSLLVVIACTRMTLYLGYWGMIAFGLMGPVVEELLWGVPAVLVALTCDNSTVKRG